MKKLNLILLSFFGLSSIVVSQTITIGTQVWSSKNLDVSTFRNGDPIPEAKTKYDWEQAGINKKPAWCYYDNDPSNGSKYGKLYNWFAVIDTRGLAPTGYHIPTDEEWTKLTSFLGGQSVPSNYNYGSTPTAGKKLKSTIGWNEIGYYGAPTESQGGNGNGSNEIGFSALPSSKCGYDGTFNGLGRVGCWWSSTEISTTDAFYWYILNFSADITRNNESKMSGLAVRVIKDDEKNTSTINTEGGEINCDFAKQKYLELNPDVARAGMDAWTHYLAYGKNEGRKWPRCSEEIINNVATNDNIMPISNLPVNEYWPNGKIRSQGNKENGLYIEYYDNGKISLKENYLNGHKNGEFVDYYENGQLAGKDNYLNDKLNGVRVRYYENGKLERKIYYSNNKFSDTESIYYHENGNIKSKGNFANGEVVSFYKNGNIQEKRNYLNGILNGDEVTFYNSGKIWIKRIWENGLKYEQYFWENGNIKQKSHYTNSQKNGEQEMNYTNGHILGRFMYVNDKLQENWLCYYENNRTINEDMNYHSFNTYDKWLADMKVGFGTEIYSDQITIAGYGQVSVGDKYVGYWKNGLQNGEGTIISSTGLTKTGLWKDGKFIGEWKLIDNRHKCYQCNLKFSRFIRKTEQEIKEAKKDAYSNEIGMYKIESSYCSPICEKNAEIDSKKRDAELAKQRQQSTNNYQGLGMSIVCWSCDGTGKCRNCNNYVKKPYWTNSCSIKEREEIRPGFVLCKGCYGHGHGWATGNPCGCPGGIGWCPGEDCTCDGGWVTCDRGCDNGICSTCHGTGKR